MVKKNDFIISFTTEEAAPKTKHFCGTLRIYDDDSYTILERNGDCPSKDLLDMTVKGLIEIEKAPVSYVFDPKNINNE